MGLPSKTLLSEPGEYDAAFQGQKSHSIDSRFMPDFEKMDDLLVWKRFISDVARHLIERYGKEEVYSWYFEVTNEPDINHFWKRNNQSLMNYYDATSEGLWEVDETLRFGGPGTARGLSSQFKALMAHCDTGTNSMTGEKGVRIDFISVHRKFLPKNMIDQELECIYYVRNNHPGLKDVPFWNDEADPMAGWGKRYWWRTGSWYAAFVAQSIDLHNQVLLDGLGMQYDILSNDNGFMGDWYQRTHFARFLRDGDPSQVYLVPQPVYTIMNMLGKIGPWRYDVETFQSGWKNAGLIATQMETGDVVLLCYNKPAVGRIDNMWTSQPEISESQETLHDAQDAILKVYMEGLGHDGGYSYTEFRMDENNTNPFARWQEMGSPELPTTGQFKDLMASAYPKAVNGNATFERKEDMASFEIELPASSVVMVVLSEDIAHQPLSKIQNVKTRTFKGLNREDMVFLSWDKDDSEDLMGYAVYYSVDGKEYKEVMPLVMDEGYLHIPEKGKGYYKVQAVSYIGEKGEMSEVVSVISR
jgi:L-iduronidase